MRKITIAVLCLLLVAAMAVSAYAASGFSMSASSGTLRRGDTVTLTVSVSSSEPATSYGLMLSFDASVFELVNGTCTVGGTLVSSFNNGFAFMFQNPTAYSGAVGNVTLRVKDNAAFGSFKVSGSASVKNGSEAVSASGCSVALSVVCDHNYSGWAKQDDSVHSKICSVCNDVQTESHTWNNGTVDKPASCKEEGQKTYSCTTCAYTKTEVLPKTENHVFGNLVAVDDTNHKDVCSVCEKNITQAHTWNKGSVVKKATCKDDGEMLYTCTGCKRTKTEVIEKNATHTFGGWVKETAQNHKRICSVCQLEETADHAYKTAWSSDKTNHWHECADCKDKKDAEAHTPGAEPTETRAQTCTICGYVIKAALGHKHNYATTWTTDDTGHWYECSGCEEKGNYADHDFENDCDKDCAACGYIRETDHKFADAWTTDANNHWRVCAGCGMKQDDAAHEPGAEATATTAQGCTVCGYEIVSALGEPEEAPADETQPPVVDGEDSGADTELQFNWWILIAVAVVTIGGVVVIILIKKKNSINR